MPQSVLDEAFRTRITLTPGARTLVQTMRGAGAVAVLVSGGFTFFASRVAALAGFDHYRANELLIDNGALSGAVARPIIGRAAKEQSLKVEFAAKRSIDIADTLAVGDGANDLAMIERAGLGVAFRAEARGCAGGGRIHHAWRSDGAVIPSGICGRRFRGVMRGR
ncbi:MAG: HAD-IB family phosphatase [Parvularculaceae bacterium]